MSLRFLATLGFVWVALLGGCNGETDNPGAACASSACAGHGDAAPNDADRSDAGSFSCNPLTPPPVTLGTILGIGESDAAALYLADNVPDGGAPGRVFVSAGSTLYRKHVAGGGGGDQPPYVDYSFGFQNNLADEADGRTLFMELLKGKPALIALGPGGQRSYGGLDAGDAPLIIVDGGALRGLTIRNLPYVIDYVADVSNGDAIVITESMDTWSISDERLFYGKPEHMVEYPLLDDGGDCCEDIAKFSVKGSEYTAWFVFRPGGDSDTSYLDTGAAQIPLKVRSPTPTSLAGFSFTCEGGIP